ncbi:MULTISPECIES: hypothetical protein [Burkholderiaceae]|jgi:hypothetical protein|uniref:Uncharacterized protein n=2 Tax=Burkholderiaceae TaxID=119060 RepID=A0AAW4QD61_RALPI|nr:MULTISPECIES: hypothetical protein [Burkholderiaceae]UNK04262.1 hypothetical protein MMB19_30380 [Ralstonia insidiosa]MBA9847863.1 hypothetical protein [Ralstonia pickettii]MBA9853453.1 hypothetical protein [Ralstonia pickettii]MBA9920916.1 hypothetical protein [Ralstonia pickettii]MBA9960741.1 hypothetical protein [Ralstonia pickettii]
MNLQHLMALSPWRSQWVTKRVSRTAVHRSGLVASIGPQGLVLDNQQQVDGQRWQLDALRDQADQLWREGRM